LKDSNVEYRNQLRNKLHEMGIQTSVHYPAVHRFSIYYSTNNKNLKNTEYVADNSITLPMYSKLTKDNISFITSTLKKII